MVSFKRLGVSCGVQSIVFLGKLLEIASGHCYELRVAAAHRVFFSRVGAWNHFHDRCLVVPWQAPGREALCCPGCPEAEPGSNWSRAMQEADWRAAVFIPQQFLCVYSAVFLGFTRTYGRTWAPCLTLTLSNFPVCVAYLMRLDQPPPSSVRTQSIAASISGLTSLLSESGVT